MILRRGHNSEFSTVIVPEVPDRWLRLGMFRGKPVAYYEYPLGRYHSFAGIRDIEGIHKYMLRHGDDGDFVTPVSIEKHVWVNYAGVIFTSEELDFGDRDYIPLNEDEASLLCGYDSIDIIGSDFVNFVLPGKDIHFTITLEDRTHD